MRVDLVEKNKKIAVMAIFSLEKLVI